MKRGFNRIAIIGAVAAGALSAVGVYITIFLIEATFYDAAIPFGIVSASGIVLVAAVVADPWILTTRIRQAISDTPLNSRRSE